MKVKTVVEFQPDERKQLLNAFVNLRILAKQTKAFDCEIYSHFETVDDFIDFLDEIQEEILDLPFSE